jgi:hypothetical protein
MAKITSPSSRIKQSLLNRWLAEDYPGGAKHFQMPLFLKDVAVYLGIPVLAVVLFKGCEMGMKEGSVSGSRKTTKIFRPELGQAKSQIIDFHDAPTEIKILDFIAKRAPGTLVKVRLLNTVETTSIAPVHAQIIDDALGKQFIGATMLGDASSDGALGRIRMDFRFVRMKNRNDVAVPLTARALSLDGTFGILAEKKEGFFARAAIRSTQNGNTVDTSPQDFKSVIARALASGLAQEFQSEAAQAHQQAQVLTLPPATEFFVELTDYFPGGQR